MSAPPGRDRARCSTPPSCAVRSYRRACPHPRPRRSHSAARCLQAHRPPAPCRDVSRLSSTPRPLPPPPSAERRRGTCRGAEQPHLNACQRCCSARRDCGDDVHPRVVHRDLAPERAEGGSACMEQQECRCAAPASPSPKRATDLEA